MRMTGRCVLVLCAAILLTTLTGCAKRIDGSSQEAFEESVEAIAESLSEEKKKELGINMLTLIMHEGAQAGLSELGRVPERVRESLDGMTADEVQVLSNVVDEKE